MFTKIVRTFLPRSDSSFKDQHNQAVDQQLRADLATAAESGMLMTKSRDSVSASHGTDKVVISTSMAKKRKVDENEGISPERLPAKRRHTSLDLSTDPIQGAPKSSTPLDDTINLALPKERTIIKDRDRKDSSTDAAESTGQEEKHVNIVASEPTQLPIGDEPPLALNTKGRNETINSSAVIDGSGSSEYVDAGYALVASPNGPTKKHQTGKGKRGSALGKMPERMVRVDTRHIAVGSKDSHNIKVPQHTRFGSEEPGKSGETLKLQTHEEVDADTSDLYQVTVEDESDNDAPDVITTTAGLLQSRIATTEAAKAVKRYVISYHIH